jgi:hypothetical protein
MKRLHITVPIVQPQQNQQKILSVRSAKESLWTVISPEVLLRIFKNLNYTTLRRCGAVCRYWLECTTDQSLAAFPIITLHMMSKWRRSGQRSIAVGVEDDEERKDYLHVS